MIINIWAYSQYNYYSWHLCRYQIGEVFVNSTMDDTTAMLETSKVSIKTDIGNMDKKCEEFKAILQDLKVQLYAKFGNNINLEAEDDSWMSLWLF